MTWTSKRFTFALALAGLYPFVVVAEAQAKELTERDCKAKATKAIVLAEMNLQQILRPPSKVESIEFMYLETARKPYFCAYHVNDTYLFAAIPEPSPAGKLRFKFDFLD